MAPCTRCGDKIKPHEHALTNAQGTRHLGGCPDESLRAAWSAANAERIEREREELRRRLTATEPTTRLRAALDARS